jgi:hypothetical protein
MSKKILAEEKCDHNKFQRLRFFHGMLLDDRDFTNEQQYHIEKRKLHNRMLHGWGIVCGLEIVREDDLSKFVVTQGMALDCHGNEILVCNDVTVDLKDLPCSSSKEKSKIIVQEDCDQQAQGAQNEITRYIGIRYHEKATVPVPVYITDDECGKQDCANSRLKEGFCIDILEECPDHNVSGYEKYMEPLAYFDEIFQAIDKIDKSKLGDMKIFCKLIKEKLSAICIDPFPCPECCPDVHYVGLGKIVFDENNCIVEIDPCECRQYVISNFLIQNSIYGLWCVVLNMERNLRRLRLEVDETPKATAKTKAKTAKKPPRRRKSRTQQEQQSDDKE